MINEHVNEFYVTLLSNASTLTYDNKLSEFKNDLPGECHFKPDDNWMVCLKSVGFSTSFFNVVGPVDENRNRHLPSIVFNRLSENELETPADLDRASYYSNKFLIPEQIHEGYCAIYLDKAVMTVDAINTRFQKARDIIPEIEINVALGKRPTIRPSLSHKDLWENVKRSASVLILMHESTRQTFKFPRDEFSEACTLNGELYHVYKISKSYNCLTGLSKNWYYKYPELVQVECSEIKEQIHDSNYRKYLNTICPNFNPSDSYFTHTFDVEEYCELSNTYLSSLSIKLKDSNSKLLNLLPGPASFVKLKFKKMDGNKFFNVKLSSATGDIHADLPQPIHLDSKWRVSLTSISYPSEIYGLPTDEKQRTIEIQDTFGYDTPQRKKPHYCVVPVSTPTIDELKEMINSFMRYNDRGFLSEESQQLIINLKPNTILKIPRWAMELLGYRNEDFLDTCMKYFGDFLQVENDTGANLQLRMSGVAACGSIRPEYILVYCDVIRPCVVASDYLKLMTIVPLTHSTANSETGYATQEFAQPESHEIESTRVKLINIALKTHWGSSAAFPHGKKVFVNLRFSCIS
jgi:hypothetical protein